VTSASSSVSGRAPVPCWASGLVSGGLEPSKQPSAIRVEMFPAASGEGSAEGNGIARVGPIVARPLAIPLVLGVRKDR